MPGYALSPDEDEDSGADSLNEHLGNIEGKKLKNPWPFLKALIISNSLIHIFFDIFPLFKGSSTNGSQSFGVPHCSVPSCMHCYHGNQIQNQSQALVPYGRDSHHGKVLF